MNSQRDWSSITTAAVEKEGVGRGEECGRRSEGVPVTAATLFWCCKLKRSSEEEEEEEERPQFTSLSPCQPPPRQSRQSSSSTPNPLQFSFSTYFSHRLCYWKRFLVLQFCLKMSENLWQSSSWQSFNVLLFTSSFFFFFLKWSLHNCGNSVY